MALALDELKGFALFRGITDEYLSKMIDFCHVYPIKEGDKLFAEGARAIDIHLCNKGIIEAVIWVRAPWNKNVLINRIEAGGLLGWSALVAPYTYTASAYCIESGEEIRINGGELLSLMDQECQLGYLIMKNLSAEISNRLTQTRQRLSIELLSGGSQSGSSIWGETGKR